MDKDILAKKTYDAYCEAVGGKAFNGDALPNSTEFFSDPSKQKQADAWRKALEPTYNMLLATTRNLGHPAYGQSTATTMAVDELREEAFNYLEIPRN